MSDYPVLFSAPMIRALRAGRKTQTRRLLSKRNTWFNGGTWPKTLAFDACDWANAWIDPGPSPAGNSGPYLHVRWPYGRLNDQGDETLGARIYPRIRPGDRLWVKETFQRCPNCREIDFRADANSGGGSGFHCRHCDANLSAWKSSLFLSRTISRFTLAVSNVRIERLQDISEVDAIAEGCVVGKVTGHAFESIGGMRLGGAEWKCARDWYADLWETINGEGAWDANPWVVALTFAAHHCNIDGGRA